MCVVLIHSKFLAVWKVAAILLCMGCSKQLRLHSVPSVAKPRGMGPGVRVHHFSQRPVLGFIQTKSNENLRSRRDFQDSGFGAVVQPLWVFKHPKNSGWGVRHLQILVYQFVTCKWNLSSVNLFIAAVTTHRSIFASECRKTVWRPDSSCPYPLGELTWPS